MSRQIERALRDVSDERRVEVGLNVARALIDRLGELLTTDTGARPVDPARVLQALLRRRPDGTDAGFEVPLIPLLDTTLLTNAPGEPTMWSQLRSEIDSADEIHLVMAFIRQSGIRPLLDPLRRHCAADGVLRVLTTTYTDSTERRALDQLVDLGADVRVSYDLDSTRLHAKAWVFHRRSGFSTAYVGSSNLTHSAQVTGLEWNVRVSAARNPDVIAKFGAVFDSYWLGGDFVPYDPAQFDAERERASPVNRGPHVILSPIELRPHPFQERLLELLGVLDGRIDHVHTALTTHSDAPPQVHARYTRIEILAAFGLHSGAKIPAWQSGVYEAKSANAELFAFTLDKSSGGFSPTTRYRDYAISRTLIHWESQSVTRADSATGLRYRHHERDGRTILLFTRLRADDRAFWFLGPATYRGHVGERPMAITWELHHPLSGDLYQSFAAAVARAPDPARPRQIPPDSRLTVSDLVDGRTDR